MRTRIKFCGITRPEDARAAAELGADAIGLVFYPPSSRYLNADQAADVVAALPAFVNRVALFVDEDPAAIEHVLKRVPVDTIQFHGNESRRDCERFGLPYLKALRVRSHNELRQCLYQYPSASALLLDTYDPRLAGGTGRVFDWQLFPKDHDQPLILAGGLTPDNVVQAVQSTRPYGVDVSGGVEQAKGVKSYERMKAFVEGVNRVEREN